MLGVEGQDLVGVPYIPIFSALNPSNRKARALAPKSKVQGNYVDNTMRIISASYVTADSGTGLVHCAPAHGMDDYNLFCELALLPTSSSSSMQNMICHVDEDGRFIPEIADVVGEGAAKELVGKEVLNDG